MEKAKKALPEKAGNREPEEGLRKKLGIFLAVTFAAWAGLAVFWLCGLHYGDEAFHIALTGMLLLPAVAALVSRKLCGEEINVDSLRISPHLRGNMRRYLFAYLFPTLLTVLGSALFFLAFPKQYDPWGSSFIQAFVDSGVERETASGVMYSQVLLAVLAGPLVNIIPSFTEVLGFQGYLLPKLSGCFEKRRGLKSALLCGGIWGLWYLPLYPDGYLYGKGYGGFPFVGMLLGFAFYGLLGVVLSYLTLKTGSVIPAALARSGVTAMAATGIYFTKGGVSLLIGPSVYGAFGVLALAIFAGLYILRIARLEREGTLYYRKKD